MCKTTFVNKLMFSTINLASYFGTLTCAMRKFYLVKNLFRCLGVRVNGKRRFWMSCYLVSPCTDSGTGVISVQRLCFYEEVNLVSLIGPMLTLCFSPVWCYPGSALDLTVGGFKGRGHWLTKPSHTRVLSQFDLRIFSWILNWGVMCQEWRETNTKHRKKSQLSSTQEEVAEKVPAMLKVKKQSGSSSKYSQVGWWWWKTSKAYSSTSLYYISLSLGFGNIIYRIYHISIIFHIWYMIYDIWYIRSYMT